MFNSLFSLILIITMIPFVIYLSRLHDVDISTFINGVLYTMTAIWTSIWVTGAIVFVNDEQHFSTTHSHGLPRCAKMLFIIHKQVR